tara:strand:+ start:136 stop:657 length:522 start_codon:yes stop_codon:yes gene_type:complete
MSASISLCAAIISILPLGKYQEKKVCEYAPIIEQHSKVNNLESELVAAVIYVESGFYKTIVSSAGACGLTQVIPKYTGGSWSGDRKYNCKQLKNPRTSIEVGTKVLRWWIEYYEDPKRDKQEVLTRALCSYNAGFRCGGKRPSKGGMRYAKRVKKFRDLIKSARHIDLEKGTP